MCPVSTVAIELRASRYEELLENDLHYKREERHDIEPVKQLSTKRELFEHIESAIKIIVENRKKCLSFKRNSEFISLMLQDLLKDKRVMIQFH